MQRCITVLVPTIDVCPAINKFLDNALGAIATGQMNSCLSILVFRIDVSITAFEQLRHDGKVTLFGGTMKQIGAAMAARIMRRWVALHNG